MIFFIHYTQTYMNNFIIRKFFLAYLKTIFFLLECSDFKIAQIESTYKTIGIEIKLYKLTQ